MAAVLISLRAFVDRAGSPRLQPPELTALLRCHSVSVVVAQPEDLRIARDALHEAGCRNAIDIVLAREAAAEAARLCGQPGTPWSVVCIGAIDDDLTPFYEVMAELYKSCRVRIVTIDFGDSLLGIMRPVPSLVGAAGMCAALLGRLRLPSETLFA